MYFFGKDETKPVQVVKDLKRYLPSAHKLSWREGYSLVETAKSWLAANPHLPPKVAALVGDLDLGRVHFEYGVRVWGGGMSQPDVMAFASAHVIAVESK